MICRCWKCGKRYERFDLGGYSDGLCKDCRKNEEK